MSTPEICQIHELKLGYSKCTSQDISVVVVQPTKKGEDKILICRECWKKLAKNDKFYKEVECLNEKDNHKEVIMEENPDEENEADEDGTQE